MIKKILKKFNTLIHLDWAWAWRYYRKHLLMYLSYYFSKISRREFYEVNVDGVKLKMSFFHPYHHLFAKKLYQGVHETQLLTMWKRKCAEIGGVILDLGAYNGIFGLVAAAANPDSEVFMFEPDPVNCRHISNNVNLNQLKNIQILQMAVTDKNEPVKFSVSFKNNTLGVGGGTSGNIVQNGGDFEVPCISLDEWAEKNLPVRQAGKKMPTLIKFDVEGAELRALVGARKILTESKNLNILLEVHYNFIKRFGDSEETLWRYLRGFGYNAVWLDKDQFNQHYWVWRERI